MHAVRMQCKVPDVGKYSNPSSGPFSQVFCSVPGVFGFPCIWDVAYLNCHPFWPIFNHQVWIPVSSLYYVDSYRCCLPTGIFLMDAVPFRQFLRRIIANQ